MRYGSVCSGIEAATVAWHPLGWSPAFFSEIERFPSEVLAHHYGSNLPGEPIGNGVPNLGDMTKFQEWPDYAIDLLVGGTPCQSFSVAGLRAGLADPRGNLMLTYLAVAARYRPRWLVWENVPGVLSSNGGRDFGTFLAGLGELGYGFAYRVLDAQYVRVGGFPHAVPQRRRRVFVVGYLGDWRRAAAVFFDAASLRGDPAPRREAGQGTATDVVSSLTASGRGVERTGETRGQDPVIAVQSNSGDISYCLTASAQQSLDAETETLVAQPIVLMERGRNGQPNLETRQDGTANAILTPNGGRGVGAVAYGLSTQQEPKWAENLCPTLARPSVNGGGQVTAVAHAIQAGALRENPDSGPDGIGVQEGIAYTVEARAEVQAVAWSIMPQNSGKDYKARAVDVAQPLMAGGPVGGNQGGDYIQQAWAVRRLTPTECERLQGFPDGYTNIPRGNGKPAADGPRYKALGNSMAVNAMRWIGERIAMVDALDATQRAAA